MPLRNTTDVDLINKACSIVCAQTNSQSKIMDQLERQKLQLDVEATALLEEKDKTSVQDSKKAEEELKLFK
ncbi:unnamed protein product [Rotaria sp. Silwood2]|nr:unnamed protein product [Rotaria sp. Silwood2]